MADLLYHYTSIETLQLIMQDFEHNEICMRATHADFLNDPQEYFFASKLFKESLKDYEKKNNILQENSIFEYIFPENGKSILNEISEISGNPYLISFSNDGDSLSMWRSYAKNGSGICIGLDKNMLLKYCMTKSKMNPAFLLQCDYLKIEHWDELTIFWKKYYTSFYVESERINVSLVDLDIIKETIEAFFKIKEQYYSEEKEFRFCVTEQSNFKIRNNGNLLIPFTELYFDKKIIKKIVIGPCLDKRMAKKGFEMFLKKHGYTDVDRMVDVSKISYRQI